MQYTILQNFKTKAGRLNKWVNIPFDNSAQKLHKLTLAVPGLITQCH